jgi:hypothetical protein
MILHIGLAVQLHVLRVYQCVHHLLHAAPVVLHVLHHGNKLLFTLIACFLLHGRVYGQHFVSVTL